MHSITISNIIFFDHDEDEPDGYAPFATLHRHDDTVVSYMPTVESIIATAQMLSQWDYGDDPHEVKPLRDFHIDEERWFIRPDREAGWIVYTEDWSVTTVTGFHDETPEVGDYVLTAHRKFGYTVLDRVEAVTS